MQKRYMHLLEKRMKFTAPKMTMGILKMLKIGCVESVLYVSCVSQHGCFKVQSMEVENPKYYKRV